MQVPLRSNSVQLQSGQIFVLGGMTNESNKMTALKDCLKIENDLLTTAKPKMHSARFDTPLALVYDRYILALGGKTSKQHGTKRCEVFDTQYEVW